MLVFDFNEDCFLISFGVKYALLKTRIVYKASIKNAIRISTNNNNKKNIIPEISLIYILKRQHAISSYNIYMINFNFYENAKLNMFTGD